MEILDVYFFDLCDTFSSLNHSDIDGLKTKNGKCEWF